MRMMALALAAVGTKARPAPAAERGATVVRRVAAPARAPSAPLEDDQFKRTRVML